MGFCDYDRDGEVFGVERRDMKYMGLIIGVVVLLIFPNTVVWSMDAALEDVIKETVNSKILIWSKDTVVLEAIRQANKEANKTEAQILELDGRWRQAEDGDAWVASFSNNPVVVRLKEFQNKVKGKRVLYPEIFIMDRQGNIVSETDKTSDYWQGDEAKFIKSFADGRGNVFIDEPEYDDSSETYSVQVSVPIIDPQSELAIGAMTVAINLDALTGELLGL
ncbi:MAG: hypothetical protein ACI9CF_000593 [Candidatus Omnitrophota bacterium]